MLKPFFKSNTNCHSKCWIAEEGGQRVADAMEGVEGSNAATRGWLVLPCDVRREVLFDRHSGAWDVAEEYLPRVVGEGPRASFGE